MSNLARPPMRRGAALDGAVRAATSTRGLSHGTELGRAQIGGRTVVYAVDAATSMWCTDGAGDQVGVIAWGDGRTPHLRLAPRDRWNRDLGGSEVEFAVWCGMALWRHVVFGDALNLRSGVRPNPALQTMAGPLYASQEARDANVLAPGMAGWS